jgi:hypothetical protein
MQATLRLSGVVGQKIYKVERDDVRQMPLGFTSARDTVHVTTTIKEAWS